MTLKVFMLVAVDVGAQVPGQTFDPQKVRETTQEAVFNALWAAADRGFDHTLKDEVSLLVDYVEVKDSDMENEF
jgi:hypothetical protein